MAGVLPIAVLAGHRVVCRASRFLPIARRAGCRYWASRLSPGPPIAGLAHRAAIPPSAIVAAAAWGGEPPRTAATPPPPPPGRAVRRPARPVPCTARTAAPPITPVPEHRFQATRLPGDPTNFLANAKLAPKPLDSGIEPGVSFYCGARTGADTRPKGKQRWHRGTCGARSGRAEAG